MATIATSLKKLLQRTESPAVSNTGCCATAKLKRPGHAYCVCPSKPQLVNLDSQDDLMQILLNFMPCDSSNNCQLVLSRINDRISLQIGCWHFEAKVETPAMCNPVIEY